MDGVPEYNCPVPFRALEVVPGMEQWLLVHLRAPTEAAALPKEMIAAKRVVASLNACAECEDRGG